MFTCFVISTLCATHTRYLAIKYITGPKKVEPVNFKKQEDQITHMRLQTIKTICTIKCSPMQELSVKSYR